MPNVKMDTTLDDVHPAMNLWLLHPLEWFGAELFGEDHFQKDGLQTFMLCLLPSSNLAL